MRILIDADGCPVVDKTVEIAKRNGLECFIICDTSHEFDKEGSQTICVSKGPDSVDFALVNMIQPGDIVITQDYGLAAMCLAKNAVVIGQDGIQYTSHNIGSMLESRHTAKKIRSAGGRLKGPKKRSAEQDTAFVNKLVELIHSIK